MLTGKVTTTEGVLIISNESGEPIAMVRKNGHIAWYKVEPMDWAGFEDLLEANNIKS